MVKKLTKQVGLDGKKDEEEKQNSWKIGPFSFDIDDEIGTEILTAEEVYEDLKELNDILVRDDSKSITAHQLHGARKKWKFK